MSVDAGRIQEKENDAIRSTDTATIQKTEGLLMRWHHGLHILQLGNFKAATYYGRCAKLLGVPVTIATTVVASAIFATLGKSSTWWIQFSAGVLTILAAVLSALQTFLGYGERSRSHQTVAVGYGELRMELQVLLVKDLAQVADLDKCLDSIRSRWSALDKGAPTLPQWIYAAAVAEAAGRADHG